MVGFRVTVKARMYHGILHEVMARLKMSRAEMAEYLGTSQFLFGDMLRMKRIPNFTSASGKLLKQKLEELTEMTVSELFPNHVFTKEFLGRDKTIQVTRDVPVNLLGNASMVQQLTLPPDEELMHKEENGRSLESRVADALTTLTQRERVVVKKRFFENKSLRETGKELGVCGARVNEIERKILRKLRGPMRLRLIRGEMLLNDPSFQSWLKADANRPHACLEK